MKNYFDSQWTLKKYLFLLLFMVPVWVLNAQPMNGNYTVGGSSPDFLTLQDAADAIESNGVSGPVFMNIRPGIYMRDGGLSSVMILDGNNGNIAGTSSVNRITFQPDEAAGGNVNNVLLQIDQMTQTQTAVVSIKVDHVTIRNLTFEDVDMMEAGANFLLSIDGFSVNPIAEDFVIEGCRFIGNSNPGGGATYGTDYGIYGSPNVANIVIRQNTFQRLMRSVEIGGAAGSSGSVIVEDNQFLNAHNHYDTQGTWIKVSAHTTIVRKNYLDNASGIGSIYGIVVEADSGLIERNTIKNGGGPNGQVPTFRAIIVDNRVFSSNALSMLVVNNMISGSASVGGWGQPIMGRYGIITYTKAQIIHNTIVHPYRQQISCGIFLDNGSDSSTVLNNIIVDYGSPEGLPLVEPIVLFKQQAAEIPGLISDYNVFFYNQPGVYLAAVGTNRYTNLSEYQAATGLDSNSIFKEIYFEIGENYPHLTDCQSQDPELRGIPYPGIMDDVDGDARSLTAPTRGADEGRLRLNPMFEDVFRYQLPGNPFAIAAGKFDNLMADGLAVTDPLNSQVLLFHNLPSSRSFVLSGTLQTGFHPTTLAFYDFDGDSNLDLIVGGDTSSVKVFWGDGAGGFPEMSEVSTYGRTFHLVPEPYQLYDSLRLVFVAHPAWVGYSAAFIGLVMNLGNRQLCYDIMRAPNGVDPDTMYHGPLSIAVGNFGGDNMVDIAGINPNGVFTNWEFLNVYMLGVPCGHNGFSREGPYRQFAGVGGNYTYANSIIMEDFDDDTDRDFITTGASIYEFILLRNEGSFNFQLEPSPVNKGRGFAKLDYDNDGDWDFVSINRELQDNGITVFLNDGTGHFTYELNCYQSLATGDPRGVVASDFDLDGKTDLAIVSRSLGDNDSLFVLYNTGNVSGIIEENNQQIPENISLSQNYPNPFNPTTTIEYSIPQAGLVTIKIFDILGREITTLVNEEKQRGNHELKFNASNLASGIYFYRLQAGNFIDTKKMILLR